MAKPAKLGSEGALSAASPARAASAFTASSSVRFEAASPSWPSRTICSSITSFLISVGWCTSEPGEARLARAFPVDEREHLVALGGADRELGELERVHQLRNPTCTLRKRAGEAPCETCACWPGWPLPQFVSPPRTHSSGPATPSSEAQKTGVWPV